MPGVLFTNLWMLAGLTALAIPVLIHLLLKRKKKRLRFSTIQFFVKQDQQSSQRRKLRHWLLLATRLLLFTLLVLAFARPYLPQSAASANARKRRQIVVVLDRSASMGASDSNGRKWDQAKERIQRITAELTPDDRMALIDCSTHSDVIAGFVPPAAFAKMLSGLEPTFGTSNLSEGLKQASKLVTTGDAKVVPAIYVVGDLQKNSVQNIASYPVPAEVEFNLVAVGDLVTPNLALSGLQVESTERTKPSVVAVSFSDEDRPDVTLELAIDGQTKSSQTIHLKAGASTPVALAIPPLRPGWHEVKAALRSNDALAADDVQYAALFVPEPLKVFVTESRQTNRSFEEESFFICAALDPTKDATNSIQRAYNVIKLRPEELVSQLSSHQSPLPCDLVVLPGLKDVPGGCGAVLTSFVRAGGGLVLFVGEGISAIRYNSEFGELLPCQLERLDTRPEVGSEWRISQFDTNIAAFAAFRRANSGDLRIPVFNQRYVFSSTEGANRCAFFDDGAPLLLTRQIGKGRVALVNTSGDTTWTDWPKHKTFVPWLHGLGKHLAQRALREGIQETNLFVAGDAWEMELGSAAANLLFKIKRPEGKEIALKTDDHGRLRDADLALPGVYSVHDGAGNELRRFAINLDSRESDLTAMSPTEFQQQLARSREPREATFAAGLFGSTSNQRELWRVLLLGVLALLFIEVFAANRTVA